MVMLWAVLPRVVRAGRPRPHHQRRARRGSRGVPHTAGTSVSADRRGVHPGEVVQIAAGLLYGPWIGALVILAGCVIPARSSSRWCTSWGRRSCRHGARAVPRKVPQVRENRQAEHHRVHPVFDPGSAERRVHVPRAAHGHANAHTFCCSPTWGAFRASWCPPTPPTGWLTDALWKARSSSRWRPSSPCWASFFASAS